MTIRTGNIWSGSRTLAWLTAPTELALRKGNMKKSYPIRYQGNLYNDAETLYQSLKRRNFEQLTLEQLFELMITVLVLRFQTYPKQLEMLLDLGGIEFLVNCSHHVNGKQPNWEGNGRDSGYVRCLIRAVERMAELDTKQCIALTKKGLGSQCLNKIKGSYKFCGPHLDYLIRNNQIGMVKGYGGENLLHTPLYQDLREKVAA